MARGASIGEAQMLSKTPRRASSCVDGEAQLSSTNVVTSLELLRSAKRKRSLCSARSLRVTVPFFAAKTPKAKGGFAAQNVRSRAVVLDGPLRSFGAK
jgi:hypothetical protein